VSAADLMSLLDSGGTLALAAVVWYELRYMRSLLGSLTGDLRELASERSVIVDLIAAIQAPKS